MFATVPVDTPSFSGHESFSLRYAWLKRGYDAVRADPEFFSREDAMVALGVGKNMVRSIRHWGLACDAWAEVAESRGRELQATAFGHAMFNDDGWDPYLEDDGSLWWLHWRLVRNTDRATAWSWLFGRPTGTRFTKPKLIAELQEIAREHGARKPSRASLKRDVDVLVRTYLPSDYSGRQSLEDQLDAPLGALGLIRPTTEKGEYEAALGAQPTLPGPVFAAAVSESVGAGTDGVRRAVSMDELLYAPLSPGRTFRLSEDAFMRHVLWIAEQVEGYSFDETAGLRQLLVGDAPAAPELLSRYYHDRHGDEDPS